MSLVFPAKSSGRGLVFYSGFGIVLDVSGCLGYLLSKISELLPPPVIYLMTSFIRLLQKNLSGLSLMINSDVDGDNDADDR